MGKPASNYVINHATIFAAHWRIQCLTIGQLFKVVCYQLLQAGERVLTSNFKSAHMRDIKQAGICPDINVLIHDPRVLKWHFPTMKIHDLWAKRLVNIIERSSHYISLSLK